MRIDPKRSSISGRRIETPGKTGGWYESKLEQPHKAADTSTPVGSLYIEDVDEKARTHDFSAAMAAWARPRELTLREKVELLMSEKAS